MLLGVPEEAVEEAVLLKLSSLVKTAVSPVTFLQLELTVVLTPVIKLTGAHWYVGISICELAGDAVGLPGRECRRDRPG